MKINFAQRYFKYFDAISFVLMSSLLIIGLLFVMSATHKPYQPYSLFFKKQLFGALSGIVLYLLFAATDYRTLMQWGYALYFVIMMILILTLVKGSIGMGAQRWINLVIFKFQPSELVKLLLPAFLTHQLIMNKDNPVYTLFDFFPVIAIIILTTLLVAKQPDLGTATLIFMSGFIILWIAGLTNKFFICAALTICLCTPLIQRNLKAYQTRRIAVFLGQGTSSKERYQLEQSIIAIGSGGLWGKGFLKGTQNKLLFLPESRTDFIFSVIAEEWGLCGALAVILLYLFFFLRIFSLIVCIKQFYPRLLALGLVTHSLFACIINIFMVIGMLPVVGIPLPFLSYGISNLWITLSSFGWIQSIVIRQSYVGD